MEQINTQLLEMLAEKVDCPVSELSTETEFAELGIDSLDIAELLMNVEDTFGVTVEMNPALKTVGDLAEKIQEGLQAAN